MTKRDRQRVLSVLLKNDCDSPDTALREIAAIVDGAIARRMAPKDETIGRLRREVKYLVDGES